MRPMKTAPWLNDALAPNSRPVRENFLDWFRGSVIATSTGEPIICAHGTRSAGAFDVFEPSKGGAQGPGIYMTQSSAGVVSEYGSRTLELAVRMTNPYVWHASEESYDAMVDGALLEKVLGPALALKVIVRMDGAGIEAYGTELTRELRKYGHDGLVVVPPWSKGFLQGDNVVIAWEASQVKLAYENNGLFSRQSASLSDSKPPESHQHLTRRRP